MRHNTYHLASAFCLAVLLIAPTKARAQGGTRLLSLAPSGTLELYFLLKPVDDPRRHGPISATPAWSTTPPDQKLGRVTQATLHVAAAGMQQGTATADRVRGMSSASNDAVARSDSAELSMVVSAAGARELQAWATASQRTRAPADISIREVDLVSDSITAALPTHVLHGARLRALSLGPANDGGGHVAQLSVVFAGYGEVQNGSGSGVTNRPANRKH